MRKQTTTRKKAIQPSIELKSGKVELFSGNVEQLIDKLLTTKIRPEDEEKILNNSHCSFYMPSLKDACKHIETGKPELLKTFLQYEKLHFSAPQSVKPGYQYETEGLFFSVPAYLEGQPEHWLNEQEEPAPGKCSDIYINISCSSMTSEEKIFAKLVKVAQFIDAAEAAGQRLNVYICSFRTPSSNFPGSSDNTFLLQVKKDSEPVNLQQLVYLVASPVILRFAIFWLGAPYYKDRFGSFVQYQRKEEEQKRNENVIYIPSFYYDNSNGIGMLEYSHHDLIDFYPHLKARIA